MLAVDELDLEARVGAILNRHPAVGLAVAVVRDGAPERFSGHGMADIASGTPVTEDTVFRVASVSKTFTAIAVMQLWERGLVDLDAPANRYLRAYRLVPARAGFRPATVRHLLTHTAGIREVLHPSGLLRPRTWARPCPWDGRCRRWPSTTGAACASTPSRAPGGATPTTGSPPSASSSRT
jgi:CubicO group peptidase (beta-lactamase class C family)